MGIFDNPQKLAKLLASVKVQGEDRPLSPIITARWLKNAVDELGNAQEVMDRVDLKKSMWDAFQRLLSIDEDIEYGIKWGKSDPETLRIGFSAAHTIASFDPSEQIALVDAMWDKEEPFGLELLLRIKKYYKSSPDNSLDDAITHVLKLDRPKKTVISIFISGLKQSIYENLVKKSKDKNIPLDDLAKQILSKQLPENSITGVKTRKNVIRIVFSEKGKKDFNKMANSKRVSKNDIVNYIFESEVF